MSRLTDIPGVHVFKLSHICTCATVLNKVKPYIVLGHSCHCKENTLPTPAIERKTHYPNPAFQGNTIPTAVANASSVRKAYFAIEVLSGLS